MRTCEVEMRDRKVACPYSPNGHVDVEKCYRCPRLRAFYDEESGTKVVCAMPARIFGGRTRSLVRRQSQPET